MKKLSTTIAIMLAFACIKLNAQTNTFLGASAGAAITTGINNTFVGSNAGALNATANDNTFVGAFAGDANTTGFTNSFFGKDAGGANTTGANNSFFGARTGELITTGFSNSFFGAHAGRFSTTGSGNVFVGEQAGFLNTTASDNSFLGTAAGYSNTTGTNNAFFGRNAGAYNTTSSNNSFFGAFAGDTNNVGISNSFFGSNAGGANTTANYNSFFGAFAGDANITGTRNAFFGTDAGGANTTGSDNSFFGRFAGSTNSTGGSNSYFGRNAGSTNTTGSTTTCIGFLANVTTGNLTNATVLGANATVNASNKVRLGRTTVTVVEGQVAYSFPSDGRFKTNIKEDVKGLEFINKLRPVTYNFETQKFDEFLNQNDPSFKERMNPSDYEKSSSVKQSGFIAQEVEQAMKETGYDFNGIHKPESEIDNYSMSYELLVVPMVKGMQELDAENKKLKSENEELKNRLDKIEEVLSISEIGSATNFKRVVLNINGKTAMLDQNIPNPSKGKTTIRFYIPENVKSAQLVVSTLNGIEIMKEDISIRGQGSILLDVSKITDGNYVYSLLLDGISVDSKQFILTR